MSGWRDMLGRDAIEQLLANAREQAPLKGTDDERDFHPVCKAFLPWTSGTWLLTEMEEDGLAFGLADLGVGCPEMGYVDMDEIWEIVGPGGLRVERDIHFKATKALSEYATEARKLGYLQV